MRSGLHGVLAVVVLAASSNAFAGEATDQRGERSLARVVEGREAGRPVDCIDARSVVATDIVDKTALVYRTPSGQLYVNRPQAGAKVLTRDMVTRQGPSGQLCKQDSLAVFWAAGGAQTRPVAYVGLGEFVPYSKFRR